jgi:hypothetical protein
MNTDKAFGAWHKSSFSGPDGNECVEVAWRKSTFSNPNGNACVEVAHGADAIGLRDSKNPAGGLLTIPPASWTTFTRTLTH